MTNQHFTSLHYTNSLGTDLTVGLPDNHIWQGGMEETASGILFNANVPTEEIYSAPQARRRKRHGVQHETARLQRQYYRPLPPDL